MLLYTFLLDGHFSLTNLVQIDVMFYVYDITLLPSILTLKLKITVIEVIG